MFMTLNEKKSQNLKKKNMLTDISDNSKIKSVKLTQNSTWGLNM